MASRSRTDQVGRAGEYFVAAELNRRGLDAVTFTGNMPGIDIVASDWSRTRTIFIQVKTRVRGNWHTKASDGYKPGKQNFFWAFVHIPEEHLTSPRFWIVPYYWVREDIKKTHDEYMVRWRERNPGKERTVDHHSIHEKRLQDWAECWDLLFEPPLELVR